MKKTVTFARSPEELELLILRRQTKEQATEIQYLKAENDGLAGAVDEELSNKQRLYERIAELTQALAFYGDLDQYTRSDGRGVPLIWLDYGKRARQALAKERV